jgi:hypothetical protein
MAITLQLRTEDVARLDARNLQLRRGIYLAG